MGRRYRRRYRQGGYRRKHREYRRRKNSGWGMGLYRNTRDGKIAGVCAGLADYWDIEHWVVRLMAVVLLCFTGTLAFWAYLAGWILLAPRRHRAADLEDSYQEADEEIEMEYDERRQDYRPKKMFRYGEDTSVRLRRARERLDAALRRVEDMETYVTSRQYNLNKEFSKL